MLMLRLFLMVAFSCYTLALWAQPLLAGNWLFSLSRPGGLTVYVQASLDSGKGTWQANFRNEQEVITTSPLRVSNDSVVFEMPVFESSFHLKILAPDRLAGTWTKSISSGSQQWEVIATHGASHRIPGADLPPSFNISGRWATEFRRADGSWRPAIAEWQQKGNHLTGTIINPSGDYRFLEGVVRQSKLYLTTFDGSHCYAFEATVLNDSTIVDGRFFYGTAPGDTFRAVRNEAAVLANPGGLAQMKPGETRIDFRFPDLDGKMVSLSDKRFYNKPVVVQLMGSWCPNCMDETLFLSSFYNGQKKVEVEIVALAYELSTDFARSAASLRKFQQRYEVKYPMLVTGVRSADEQKAAKSLPQLTDIKYFPTTIFIDKKGQVRKIHNGFYGPGAPAYFEAYKKDFFEMLEILKNE